MSRSAWFRISLLLYVLLYAGLYPWFRYRLGPDAISYLTIAGHYASGRWWEAVNTNWGPLISWLMAPLMFAGMPAEAAGHLVCGLSGVLALYAVARLIYRLGLLRPLERWSLLVAAVLISN
jgi:hypothetical protein